MKEQPDLLPSQVIIHYTKMQLKITFSQSLIYLMLAKIPYKRQNELELSFFPLPQSLI